MGLDFLLIFTVTLLLITSSLFILFVLYFINILTSLDEHLDMSKQKLLEFNHEINDEINSLSRVSKAFILFTFIYICIILFAYFYLHTISSSELDTILKSFAGVFLITNVTSAVFGIGFAFTAYQRSPYSKLLETIPLKQKIFFVTIFLLVLIPFIGFICFNSTVEARGLSLITIPSILCLSIISYEYIFKEIGPIKIVNRKCSKDAIRKYVIDYTNSSTDFDVKVDNFERTMGYRPTHFVLMRKPIQITFINKPYQEIDPFILLENLCVVAMKENDIHTFELGIRHILLCYNTMSVIIQELCSESEQNDYVYFGLKFHSADVMGKLAELCFKDELVSSYGEKLVDGIYDFVIDQNTTNEKANNFFQNELLLTTVIGSLTLFGTRALNVKRYKEITGCLGILSYMAGYLIKIDNENYLKNCCNGIKLISDRYNIIYNNNISVGYVNNIRAQILEINDISKMDRYIRIFNEYFGSL